MVFSSIQAYLDPANWQQHPPVNNYQTGTAGNDSELVPPPPPPPYGGAGSIRPGSMTDRARLANVPMPEAAAKCPRCDSTNTKFCYFNNYSLSQPRHFCKTCRRYWTRGGALRNVPVGGGLRRNRRTKSTNTNNSSSHKSQDSHSNNNSNGNTDTVMTIGSTLTSSGPIFTHENLLSQQMLQPMRFMAPPNVNQFNELININHNNNLGGFGNYYGGISGQESVLAGLEQWRVQRQQPELALLGGNNNNTDYHFSGFNQFENGIELSGMNTRPKFSIPISPSSIPARLAFSKWDGAGSSASSWTDFSNFTSSSAGNQL